MAGGSDKFNIEFQESLNPFRGALPGINQGLQANAGQVGGIAGMFGDIGAQFGQFAQGNDPLLAMRQQAAQGQLQANLARQGVTGTVAQNELNNLNQGFTQQQLAQRNQNLMAQAQLGQGQAGLLGLQNQFNTEAGQNLLAIPQINVAARGVDAASQGGDGGGASPA